MRRTQSHPAPQRAKSAACETPSVGRSHPSADLIEHTIRIWEPRLGRRLSEEDARQILENVVGFFRVLHDWDRKRRDAESKPKTTDPDHE
jgi:hypothetical protein